MSLAVQQMFARIASRYDVANDVLSMGIHRLWRKEAIRFGGVGQELRVLDFCTGTGDFAFSLSSSIPSDGSVQAIDFVPEMIEVAKEKYARARKGNPRASIEFSTGDAMNLRFDDDTFDLATVGFGIRNVDDPVRCMLEVTRVLKPSGKLIVLEFGRPRLPIFSWFYQQYSRYLMPLFGGVLTGDRSAYEYLPRTAGEFPDGERFVSLMKKAGFSEIRWRSVFLGVAYIYVGENHASSSERVSNEALQGEDSHVAG